MNVDRLVVNLGEGQIFIFQDTFIQLGRDSSDPFHHLKNVCPPFSSDAYRQVVGTESTDVAFGLPIVQPDRGDIFHQNGLAVWDGQDDLLNIGRGVVLSESSHDVSAFEFPKVPARRVDILAPQAISDIGQCQAPRREFLGVNNDL